MDSEPSLLKDPEAPADAGELMEAAPSRSGTWRSGSVRSGSGSAPAAAPPVVRRRSLVSGAVKAKSAHEEAEMEGLTTALDFLAGAMKGAALVTTNRWRSVDTLLQPAFS